MGPSFVIERFEFLYKKQWRCRTFKGLVTFLTGPAGSGKSTGAESLLYALGLTKGTVMPEVRQCDVIRLLFRVAGTRWQASRSGRSSGGQVIFQNLSHSTDPERSFPVQASKAGEASASDFVLELFGIPPMRSGAVCLNLSHVSRVMALGQATIATEYLGGLGKAERVLLFEVLLGLRDIELDRLENAADDADHRYGKAKRLLNQFNKLRETGVLTDPEAVRTQHAAKTRVHQDTIRQWDEAHTAYGVTAGEYGRLNAVFEVADKERAAARQRADEAAGLLRTAAEEQGRAQGRLNGLTETTVKKGAKDCPDCGQTLPERDAGVCLVCGQVCTPESGHTERRQEQLARAQAELDRAVMIRMKREETARMATDAATRAESAARAALTARDTYDKRTVAPQRIKVHELEKTAHGMSKELEQLAVRLEEAGYIAAQEREVKSREEERAAVFRDRDAARTAREQRRKELLHRWSELFVARVREIDPSKSTATIDAKDFTTLVDGKAFEDSSVAGGPKTVTNIAVLLSLRDLAREESDVTVPPFLLIDSPLSGFGAQGLDEQTSSRLLKALITAADDPSPDGFACQIITVTNDPLPQAYPGVREIRLSPGHRYFDHAPLVEQPLTA
ncbi:hypothetical protein ACF07F_35280 [Streptomyces sp. NPDC015237]|uniref:hypothetical protein n=1 Tax=unclassified Streptomyces TaxID=2593676 RepID=UPI0036FA91FA